MSDTEPADFVEMPWQLIRQVMSKAMEQAGPAVDRLVATEGYAKVMNNGLSAFMEATIPMRAFTNQLGELAAEWLNIPTRAQLLEVAKRVNHIEMLLDDLDVKSNELLDLLNQQSADG